MKFRNKKILYRFFILFFICICFSGLCFAGRLHSEKWYQDKWCKEHKGQLEVVLPDRTRCDCLTDTHAIEFDFGNKWAEAIGQALHYGLQTGKRPGIVLILESPKDLKYWIRLNTIIEHYKLPIDSMKYEHENF